MFYKEGPIFMEFFGVGMDLNCQTKVTLVLNHVNQIS